MVYLLFIGSELPHWPNGNTEAGDLRRGTEIIGFLAPKFLYFLY
jgi:hypothetical protein